jgi:undecaprenyl-diphosphatase
LAAPDARAQRVGWGFFKIADEVVEGETHALDQKLLLALADPQNPSNPLGPSWLEEAARDITGLGGYAMLACSPLRRSSTYADQEGKAATRHRAVCGGMMLSTALKWL